MKTHAEACVIVNCVKRDEIYYKLLQNQRTKIPRTRNIGSWHTGT